MKQFFRIFLVCLFFSSVTLFAQQLSNTPPQQPPQNQRTEASGFTPFPREMSYQGLLTTSTGAPAADGTYDLQFDLFYLPVGGSTLWTETQTGVTVSKGTFSVRLGSVTALPNFFYEINFLEVTALAGPGISGSFTFSPRTQLTAAAYSLGPWQSNNYDVYVPYANVGIGIATPTEKLHIANGNILLSSGNIYLSNGSNVFSPGTSPLMTAGHDNVVDKRMWIGHSENFPTWGMQYRDFASDGLFGDAIEYVAGNQALPRMSFQVAQGIMRMFNNVGTGTFVLNSSNGRAGIGTLTPSTNMEISAASNPTLRITSPDNSQLSVEFKKSSTTAADFRMATTQFDFLQFSVSDDIDSSAVSALLSLGTAWNVSHKDFIPNTSNSYDLGSDSWRWRDVYTINAVNSSSDIRLKENIHNLAYGLSDVMRLRPVSYTWKNSPDQGTKLGLIAQEVQPIIGEIVKEGTDEGKTLAISYTEMIPVLIKAIQEQQQLIEKLNKEVAATQMENIELRKVKHQYDALSIKIRQIENMLQESNRSTTVTTVSNK